MNIYILNLFRLTHVVAGILWAGAAISYLFFVKPSVQSIGAAGPQFMQNLMGRRKYPIFMMVTSLLTILAGGALYWYSSGGLKGSWITTGPGLGFTIGSLAGLITFFLGMFGIGPTAGRIAALGQQIATSATGPTPEQMNQMRRLEKRVNVLERVEFVLMVVAMVTMATARYWSF
ncbi:MAG: DUF1772 domain-containing protein [Candidatus Promineofilum sp.]|nr:DUF1772 domain-containing protein [Promineifilum sp.]MBP9657767.1 DUF1772 domain-containing protein [Promineifilum sp.]